MVTGAPVASRAEYRVHTKAGLTLILTAHLPLARTAHPVLAGDQQAIGVQRAASPEPA
jgi:hypothetical protein